MILDTSALMAILRDEPERRALQGALLDAPRAAISAATLVEVAMVAEGRGGEQGWPRAQAILDEAEVEVIAFTAEHAALAHEGWRRYGKGRHPAGLNLGDCFAYALAVSRNEPLLYKGTDFSLTDVKAAL